MSDHFKVKLNEKRFKDIKQIIQTDEQFTAKINSSSDQEYIIKQIEDRGEELQGKIVQNIIDQSNPQGDSVESVQFSREEIFIILVMMYFELFERLFNCKEGFYLVHMYYLKQHDQKLECIYQYFKHFLENREEIKNEKVTYSKTTYNTDNFEEDINTTENISVFNEKVEFTLGRNEDQNGAIIVDFADENIGGLVLNPHDIAQEEILMLIYPEAIICMLLITPMQQNQAAIIQNLIRYNNYQGYERSFQYMQKQFNRTDINHLLAIDAKHFYNTEEQLSHRNIMRELIKSFIGFSLALRLQKNQNISTGKWGCGVFRGDYYLKTLIQLCAFQIAKSKNKSENSRLFINSVQDEELKKFGGDLKQNFQNVKFLDLIKLIQNLKESDLGIREPNCRNILVQKLQKVKLQQSSSLLLKSLIRICINSSKSKYLKGVFCIGLGILPVYKGYQYLKKKDIILTSLKIIKIFLQTKGKSILVLLSMSIGPLLYLESHNYCQDNDKKCF